ncbi:hypothetical protein L596_002903 [Steinernema carpocapsae]|uniref:EGF-like domain-containing protein n=1 Tax=Steinernema carpocapsae TaxID=34508 RepID=A0A4U8UQT7_STECR|nr:hypothetical protein L596_002903 [Steinernema carpocapsae]
MPPRLFRNRDAEASTITVEPTTSQTLALPTESTPAVLEQNTTSNSSSFTEKESFHFHSIEKAFHKEINEIAHKPMETSTQSPLRRPEATTQGPVEEAVAKATGVPRAQFHAVRNTAIHFPAIDVSELKSAELIGRSGSETIDMCAENPCKNSGLCFNSLSTKEGFRCICKGPWTGKTCDMIDFCTKNQCQNGTCINAPETLEKYRCVCAKDFAGKLCNRPCSNVCRHNSTCFEHSDGDLRCASINECNQLKCKNGAKCVDLWNDYKCQCPVGYMGKNCDRPCQDVYKSCKLWKRQNQCELMRPTTDFFDKNCAATCDQCKYQKSTIITDRPLAPVLLPLAFLLGVWKTNVTGGRNETIDFPVDFKCGGYEETLFITVTEVMMFGTPSINFTSVSVNMDDPSDKHVMHGFLTIRQYPESDQIAALTTVSNLGLQIIEEGAIRNGNSLMFLQKHLQSHPDTKVQIPAWMERTFARNGARLVQSISKRMPDGRNRHLTKQYQKVESIRYL